MTELKCIINFYQKLIFLNAISTRIVKAFADLITSKKSQISLTHIVDNRFSISSHNPKMLQENEVFWRSMIVIVW